jgi:AraC-like DNA-binding protein
MKTLIQKIHIEEQHSFACNIYRTPKFETNWHKHEEAELIVITEGHGTAMIGDYVGEYKTGDVYFLAGNLPHWFRKHQTKMVGSAIVVHFKQDMLGNAFLQMPEIKTITNFLNKNDGIQLQRKLKKEIGNSIMEIHEAKGFQRVFMLLQCLQQMSVSTNYTSLTQNFSSSNNNINPAIEKIIDYSFNNYLQPITLQQVAEVADMSIPTFCRFFKKNIKKTYFDFLQDLRISHACKLLNNTNKPVLEICYESGYNSWAHFSKQFKHVKQLTPTQYRKQFEEKSFN